MSELIAYISAVGIATVSVGAYFIYRQSREISELRSSLKKLSYRVSMLDESISDVVSNRINPMDLTIHGIEKRLNSACFDHSAFKESVNTFALRIRCDVATLAKYLDSVRPRIDEAIADVLYIQKKVNIIPFMGTDFLNYNSITSLTLHPNNTYIHKRFCNLVLSHLYLFEALEKLSCCDDTHPGRIDRCNNIKELHISNCDEFVWNLSDYPNIKKLYVSGYCGDITFDEDLPPTHLKHIYTNELSFLIVKGNTNLMEFAEKNGIEIQLVSK